MFKYSINLQLLECTPWLSHIVLSYCISKSDVCKPFQTAIWGSLQPLEKLKPHSKYWCFAAKIKDSNFGQKAQNNFKMWKMAMEGLNLAHTQPLCASKKGCTQKVISWIRYLDTLLSCDIWQILDRTLVMDLFVHKLARVKLYTKIWTFI